jgi:hypothetical protein
MRIVTGEKYWRVVLAGVAQGSPIEISRAIGGETEPFATSESRQIHRVLLTFQVEREEGFDPFRCVF